MGSRTLISLVPVAAAVASSSWTTGGTLHGTLYLAPSSATRSVFAPEAIPLSSTGHASMTGFFKLTMKSTCSPATPDGPLPHPIPFGTRDRPGSPLGARLKNAVAKAGSITAPAPFPVYEDSTAWSLAPFFVSSIGFAGGAPSTNLAAPWGGTPARLFHAANPTFAQDSREAAGLTRAPATAFPIALRLPGIQRKPRS